MKVFVENKAGSDQKNIYNEKTLEYKKTVTVSRKYPYPYGFILDTTSEDGDNLDCFIITDKPLTSGQIVECEPIGLMEQFEKPWDPAKAGAEEADHNVLAALADEPEQVVTEETKSTLTEFVLHVFDHIRKDKNRVGQFLDKDTAVQQLKSCEDSATYN